MPEKFPTSNTDAMQNDFNSPQVYLQTAHETSSIIIRISTETTTFHPKR